MKMLAVISVVFLCLQAIVCAVPYNTTIGPYNISFDMGFDNYYLTLESPWNATETLSGQKYEVGNVNVYKNSDHTEGIAIIGISHNDKDQSYSSAMGPGEVARNIDGVSGSITSLSLDNGITIYMAAYHPSFDPKRVNVTIISNYPWDTGTLELLKTIHVTEASKENVTN